QGHLFPSPRTPGQPLSFGGFSYTFKAAAKAAGLDDVRPHDLRHTGATLAAATGATTRELMARLGPTSPEVAMRYQHATAQRDRAVADRRGEPRDAECRAAPARSGRGEGLARAAPEVGVPEAETVPEIGPGATQIRPDTPGRTPATRPKLRVLEPISEPCRK